MTVQAATVPAGRHRRCGRRLVGAIGLALLVGIAAVAPVSAVTATNTWQAKIGSAGVNGTAQVQALGSGTGSVVLKLTKLKPSTSMAVVISKGACTAVGTTLATLVPLKTSSTGTAKRTSALSPAQVIAISNATRSSGRMVIRIGSGTTRKCGQFAIPAPVVGATIPVGALPLHAAVDTTGLWVTNSLDRTLSKIDPKTNTVVSVYPAPPDLGFAVPVDVATGFGSIWVTYTTLDLATLGFGPGWVVRVDPAIDPAVAGSLAFKLPPSGQSFVVASPEAIWVANGDGAVLRIDPITNQIAATIATGGRPSAMAVGFGSIWVSNQAGRVDRIDPATNQVASSILTSPGSEGIASGAGSIWVADYGTESQPGSTVTRIDPSSNAIVASIPVGPYPIDVSVAGASVWVGLEADPGVVRIDPASGKVASRTAIGAWANSIVATDHAVWVVQSHAAGAQPGSETPGTVTRINY